MSEDSKLNLEEIYQFAKGLAKRAGEEIIAGILKRREINSLQQKDEFKSNSADVKCLFSVIARFRATSARTDRDGNGPSCRGFDH